MRGRVRDRDRGAGDGGAGRVLHDARELAGGGLRGDGPRGEHRGQGRDDSETTEGNHQSLLAQIRSSSWICGVRRDRFRLSSRLCQAACGMPVRAFFEDAPRLLGVPRRRGLVIDAFEAKAAVAERRVHEEAMMRAQGVAVCVRTEEAAGDAHPRNRDAPVLLQVADDLEQRHEQAALLGRRQRLDGLAQEVRPAGGPSGLPPPAGGQGHGQRARVLGATALAHEVLLRQDPHGVAGGGGGDAEKSRHLGEAQPPRPVLQETQDLSLGRREAAQSGLLPGLAAQREPDLREPGHHALGQALRVERIVGRPLGPAHVSRRTTPF